MKTSTDSTQETAPKTEHRRAARLMYWQGYSCAEIARTLDLPPSTVSSWRARDRWDQTPVIERVSSHIDVKVCQLVSKPSKSNADYKELDQLMRQLERVAKIERYGVTGKPSHLNEKQKGNHIDKRAPKNQIDEEATQKLVEAFRESLYPYQSAWHRQIHQRIRNLLKSRQIGATWYFAREALIDAITGGGNQIFLSASRAQAEVFRGYIIQFVSEVAGIELTGNPIVLSNDATLYFLSTSSRTAQSYHGHIYMDEYFWIPRFTEFRKVASGMAMHKKWRQTYISTASSLTHEAYAFWAGKGKKGFDIDISHKALQKGQLCEDGQWRQIVNIEDAIAAGCDLFDIEQLRTEYTDEEFTNLLMCGFIDDVASFFSFDELMACGVDSLTAWPDFSYSAARPIGNKPVWVGYDPSRSIDNAAVIVVAPPQAKGGPFRVLEKHEWKGSDFVNQAAAIKKIIERYNVEFMGIDTTGIGAGVYDLVHNFYPAAKKINYNPESKSRLVIRGKELTRSRRIQWDAGWNDLARALLCIRQSTTPSGSAVTFIADRSKTTGHADLAWALLHALEAQPIRSISSDSNSSSSLMQLSED